MHVFRFICHPWSLTHNPLLELRWEELWAGFGSCSRRKVWFCHEFQASSWKGHPQVWAGCCINLPLKVLSTGCPWNSGTHPLCLGNFMFPQILPENTPWIFLINHFMFGLVYGRAWSCVGLKIFFFLLGETGREWSLVRKEIIIPMLSCDGHPGENRNWNLHSHSISFLGFLPSSLVLPQITSVKWSLALLPAFNWHCACQRCFGAALCKKNYKKPLSAVTQSKQ